MKQLVYKAVFNLGNQTYFYLKTDGLEENAIIRMVEKKTR